MTTTARGMNALRKMRAGTVGGQSKVATPANSGTRRITSNATTPRPAT